MIRKSSHSSREADLQLENEVSPPPSVRRRISFLNELNRIAGAQLASFDPLIYQETISGILRPCLRPNPIETETSVSVPNSGCARGEWSANCSMASGVSILPADGDFLSSSLPVPIRRSEENNIGSIEEVSGPNSNSGCARGGRSDGGGDFPSARHFGRPADGENTSPSLRTPSGMDSEEIFGSSIHFGQGSPNRPADGDNTSPSVLILRTRGSQEVSGSHSESRHTEPPQSHQISRKASRYHSEQVSDGHMESQHPPHSDQISRKASRHHSKYQHTDPFSRRRSQQFSDGNLESQDPRQSDPISRNASRHHSEHQHTDPFGTTHSEEFSDGNLESQHPPHSYQTSQKASHHHSEQQHTEKRGRRGSQEECSDGHSESQHASRHHSEHQPTRNRHSQEEFSDGDFEHQDTHQFSTGGSQELSDGNLESQHPLHSDQTSQKASHHHSERDQSAIDSQEVSSHHSEPLQTDHSEDHHTDERGGVSEEVSGNHSEPQRTEQRGRGSQSIPTGSGSQEIRSTSNQIQLRRSPRKRSSNQKSFTDCNDDDYVPSSPNDSSTSSFHAPSEVGNSPIVPTEHRPTTTRNLPQNEVAISDSMSGFKTFGLEFSDQARMSENEFDSCSHYSSIPSNASFLNSSPNNHSQQEDSDRKQIICIDCSDDEGDPINFGEGFIESSRSQSKPVIQCEGKRK